MNYLSIRISKYTDIKYETPYTDPPSKVSPLCVVLLMCLCKQHLAISNTMLLTLLQCWTYILMMTRHADNI